MRHYSIILFINLLLASVSLQVHAQRIVVNPENETKSLSQSTLKAIFSMRLRTWPNGTPIIVFIQNPDSKNHRDFCLTNLGVLPYQIQRVWDVLVFSGTGQSPIELSDDFDMKQKIGQVRGAIGYVSETGEADDVIPVSIH